MIPATIACGPAPSTLSSAVVRVLIIEDEEKTSRYLRQGLTENGFVVDTAENGVDGLHLARSVEWDAVICDVMLPGVDGWTIVSDIRDSGSTVPILMLTARDAVQDRVRGLELGADDYLVKPFAFSELLARLRSLLRRGTVRPIETWTAGDLEIDPTRHRAVRDGVELSLSPKEFLLLSLFVRRRGEVLSRTVIAEQVWDMNFESDTNVIDVTVRRLRQKVDDPFETKLIHTVRGVGYTLKPPA